MFFSNEIQSLDPAFERLMNLANKRFGRQPKVESQMQDICFSLGHTCREDYMEVLFLALNGYATGAQKLVRGLYERAVVLAYIIKRPEKAERFLRFAAIQEFKLLNAALQVRTEEEFDQVMKPKSSAAEIRTSYEEVRPAIPGNTVLEVRRQGHGVLVGHPRCSINGS